MVALHVNPKYVEIFFTLKLKGSLCFTFILFCFDNAVDKVYLG